MNSQQLNLLKNSDQISGWMRANTDIKLQSSAEYLEGIKGNSFKLRVSVIPNGPIGLGNRIFNKDFVINTHWMESNIRWFEKSLSKGIALATYDLMPVDKADVVVVMDLPENRKTIYELRNKAPNAKLILLLYESPFERPHWFDSRNHSEFDLVLTYNPKLIDGVKYRRFYLPVGNPPPVVNPRGYIERLPCVMLNTNHYYGIASRSRPWHWVSGFRNLRRSGWRFNYRDVIRVKSRINYDGRRRLARAGEEFVEDVLDVYGGNWNGSDQGWIYRFFPDPPYQRSRGPFNDEKLSLLSQYRFVIAYENYVSNDGYISEKIFDALHAGAVPIYLGDENISEYVDVGCFIDASKFKRPYDVLRYAAACDQKSWEKMQAAGQEYLTTENSKLFGPEYFANTMIEATTAHLGKV